MSSFVKSVMKTTEPDIQQLLDMLTYRRAEDSVYQQHFCRKYLKPVFGKADMWGNYTLSIPTDRGLDSPIAFVAHHDTVHTLDGQQTVVAEDGFAYLPTLSRSNCLGADCTTGVWLILHMIKNNIPGRYIVHSGEEVGLVGANHLIKDNPDWLNDIKIMISFDRKDTNSIVTHQMSRRTCSDEFAWELNALLGGGFKPDPTGSFTDSEAYSTIIPECTNLSVGYYSQHTKRETQDLDFARELAIKLVNANWDKLNYYRDPLDVEYEDYYHLKGYVVRNTTVEDIDGYGFDEHGSWGQKKVARKEELVADGTIGKDFNTIYKEDKMEDIIAEYPSRVADWMRNNGVSREMLITDLGLWEEENW